MRPSSPRLIFSLLAANLALGVTATARAQDKPAEVKPTLVPPKLSQPAEATYPKEAQDQGLSGAVLLELDIDATGTVSAATVSESAGHGFDEAAVEAAKKFVFEPATKDGKPIRAHIKYRYSFTWKALTPDVPKVPPTTTTTAKPTPKSGELRGAVKIGGADEPIEGASVVVTGPDGSITKFTLGKDGGFEAKGLAPGVYHVTIDAAGFVAAKADETVEAGKRVEVTYRLTPVPVEGEIVVVGKRPSREVTVHTLEKRELERIPGTNGDALKGIQTMPGVGRSPGLGAQLIIRGAAPQDTQVFVEGVPIPIVYHFGGISSVIPTEMLERIDFRPGNFGAEFGRVMGGIVDVRTAPVPTDGKFHALAQADFIDTRFVAKGPIPLLDGWAFVAGARRSYVDLWLKPLLSRRGGGFTAAPVYYDWQGFAEKHPTPDSRIRVGFYGSDDSLTIIRDTVNTRDPAETADIGLHTAFGRFQGSYEAQLSKSVRFNQVLAWGWDVRNFQTGTVSIDVVAHPLTDRSELSFVLAKGYTLHLGADVQYTTTKVNLTVPPPRVPGEPASGSTNTFLTESDAPTFFQPAIYSEMEMQFTKRLRIVPGFRIDYTGTTQHFETSPRISGRFDLVTGPDKTTLKGGVGAFYQPPQPLEISPVFGTPGLYANRSSHTSIGIEQSVMRRVEISIEGFYKTLDNLVARAPAQSGGFNYTNLGSGTIYGSEILIRYKPDERFFGWIAYTLSRSTRRESDSVPIHLFQYDQTHILTVLGSYRLGGGWELGARFRFVSGNLFTPCNGGAMDGTTGSYTCISGARFSERLPPFHQIDLRIDKHWYYASWQMSTYLDVYNAYNRGNPEGIAYNYDYSQKIYQTGLPIIPSLGLRGEF